MMNETPRPLLLPVPSTSKYSSFSTTPSPRLGAIKDNTSFHNSFEGDLFSSISRKTSPAIERSAFPSAYVSRQSFLKPESTNDEAENRKPPSEQDASRLDSCSWPTLGSFDPSRKSKGFQIIDPNSFKKNLYEATSFPDSGMCSRNTRGSTSSSSSNGSQSSYLPRNQNLLRANFEKKHYMSSAPTPSPRSKDENFSHTPPKRVQRVRSPLSVSSQNTHECSSHPPRPERKEQPDCEMDVTVFIGNLPTTVTEKELMRSFRLWGFPPLRARLRELAGRKKGKLSDVTSTVSQSCKIAFVDLPNLGMAEAMVRKFNRKKLFGSDCVRVEIEKRHASSHVREDPSHNDRIQSLLKNKGWVSLSEIFVLYQQNFGQQLRVLDNTHLLKLLVKCDNLLILNAKGPKSKPPVVWVFASTAPTFNTVVKILKRYQHTRKGVPMPEFQKQLEAKFGFRQGELSRFDLESFLRRWRVVQIQDGNPKTVKLSPSNLHTVFLGCLGHTTTSKEVASELTKIGFSNVPIRMKSGNGNTMAFVDVPTFKDAQKLVNVFHGKRLLGGTNIRAEIEKSCRQFRSVDKAGKRPDSKSGRVYALLNEAKGKILLSQLVRRYKLRYGQNLSRTNSSLRTLVQMDMLLLLNTKDHQDIFIVRTPELGPKIVRNICACFPEGLSIDEFQLQLEGRLGQKLSDCDIRSFLTRWRFLEIRKHAGMPRTSMVHLKVEKYSH